MCLISLKIVYIFVEILDLWSNSFVVSMKYLSPKKLISNEVTKQDIHQNEVPPVLFELSPNLIYTYGKCQRRRQLSNRLRFSTLSFFSDHFRKIIDQSNDCKPNDKKQFSKYLDLISTEELKDKPRSRLQSRHPLRHISRVSLRPKPTDKVDIKTMELSSHLRKVCLKGVESLTQSDIESKILETEVFCKTDSIECNYNFGHNLIQTQRQTNNWESISMTEKRNEFVMNFRDNPIEGRICSLVLNKLEICPNCFDPLFNRSRKNTNKRRFHSCLKGIVNNQLSNRLQRVWSFQ